MGEEAYLRQLEDQEAARAARLAQDVANAKAEARARRTSWECERCPGVRFCPSRHRPSTKGSMRIDRAPDTRCAVCDSLAPEPDRDWIYFLPEAMRRRNAPYGYCDKRHSA